MSSSKHAAVVRLESYGVARAFTAEVHAARLARAADARASKVAARAEKASRAFLHAKAVHEAVASKLAATVAHLAASAAARGARASLKRAAMLEAKVCCCCCARVLHLSVCGLTDLWAVGQLEKCVAELAKVNAAKAATAANAAAANAVLVEKMSDATARREAHMNKVCGAAAGGGAWPHG